MPGPRRATRDARLRVAAEGAAVLGLAFVAAILTTWPARRPALGAAAVAAVAVIVVLVEGFAPWTDQPKVSVSEVDRALAREPRSRGVLYLPALLPHGLAAATTTFGQVENVFGTTEHHRNTQNGYSGLLPREFRTLSARMRNLPSRRTLDEPRSIDVRFVVVRGWARGTPWEPLLDPSRASPLRFLGRYGDDVLYEVPQRS